MRFPDFTIRTAVYPAGLRMPRHDHPWTNVTAVVRGQIVETTDDSEHRARSCSVVVKPGGTMHADRVLGPGAAVSIAIELRNGSELARLAADHRWSWLEAEESVRAALALQQALRRSSRQDVECAAQALLATALTLPPPSASPPWLAHLLRAIESDIETPARFETLAREVGLHPVYVSRAFRRFTGRTMRAHVRSIRLRAARHFLSTTRRSLSAVAAECGFSDASHLSRAFAATYAMTPGAFRAICGA